MNTTVILNSTLKYIIDESLILLLYDSYNLCVGEIASLMSMSYHKTNRIIVELNVQTKGHSGRRNSNFSIETSKEKSKKMSASLMGRKGTMKGKMVPISRRRAISETLKKKYHDGTLSQDGVKQSEAWKRGCYESVKFGYGYQGYFTSYKFNTVFYFRSLLELSYYILWEKSEYKIIVIEPFHIDILVEGKKRIYTPDALIDDNIVVEIKPQNHLRFLPDDSIRFRAELEGINKYCKERKLQFKLMTDVDIGFTSDKFKRWLNNNLKLLQYHNVLFNNKTPIRDGSLLKLKDI